MGWQPMDTAPLDRQVLVALRHPTGTRVVVGRWESDQHSTTPRPYWRTGMPISYDRGNRERAVAWRSLEELVAELDVEPGAV